MTYNPMSEDDYEAIGWLEERSRELPALGIAWKLLESYYEDCKNELKSVDLSQSPFEDNGEKEDLYHSVREKLENDRFVKEVEDFLGASKDEIIEELNHPSNDSKQEWMIAKIMRLYNMHLKLGHSARITYVAEQALEKVPERENTEVLRRTVLLSALLHDIGRFYQAAHYNNIDDSHMKKVESQIGNLKVDHAVAGYYYSLASALELHKLGTMSDEEEMLRFITEAVAAVVVKCHQKSNASISYFDYAGSSRVLDDEHLVEDTYHFINDSYEQAHLMNLDVEHQMKPKHKVFIDQFVSKIKGILFSRKIDYSAASGFEVEEFFLDEMFQDLDDEIHSILHNMHGLSSSEVTDRIVEIMNRKVKELSYKEFDDSEKKKYHAEIEETLKGVLDYDIALSVEDRLKSGENIPGTVRYLLSSSMYMTMDADKIDILNQRALGIYNTSYKIYSLNTFPTEGNSLREILNQRFHFHLDSEPIILDSKVLNVVKRMNPKVLEMIHKQLGAVDIIDPEKFPQDAKIEIYRDRVLINGIGYSDNQLHHMFQDEWISYVSDNMNLERESFEEFKKKYYYLLPISISREDLEDNLKDKSDEEKIEVLRSLLISDGMKQRFMLEGNNGIKEGWVLDSENSEDMVHGAFSGLIWQLNQFVMTNMRNKSSYEFIERYQILDQIYEQYLEKDPMVAAILKEYVDYCKKFINYSLREIKEETFTGDDLADMRKKIYAGSDEELRITY